MSQSRTVARLLLGGALLLGANLSTAAQAEELRIGFIAPMTGLFAQVGKDMVDGFQLYLDEHGNKLGGADGNLSSRTIRQNRISASPKPRSSYSVIKSKSSSVACWLRRVMPSRL